jgi:two-component system, NtrC family, response regulator AtoC
VQRATLRRAPGRVSPALTLTFLLGMDDHCEPDDPTAPRGRPGATHIRIFGERVFLAHPVPRAGSLTIGRAEECDIVVNEHSVSRVHARLHFGDAIVIEDAGSSNGTRVGPVELGAGQRCALAPGQVAELGVVLVTIDAPAQPVRAAACDGPRAAAPPTVVAGAARPGQPIVVLDGAMITLHRLIERVAGGEISVLLTGETGVGKEVAAEQIHLCSPRRDQPFLRLNCAALVEPLAESELFGHEKGAFTGATRAKPGLLASAAGGTVFLDEVGEMPLALQAKLLRVLDERQVWPVGSVRPQPIDVRFVAATNRVLEDEIDRGRFRQDLYFRLSGVTLQVPPLRARPREVLALAEMFAARAAAGLGLPSLELTAAARAALAGHGWPGNVRELKNVIERAALLARGNELDAFDLRLDMRLDPARAAAPPSTECAAPSPAAPPAAGSTFPLPARVAAPPAADVAAPSPAAGHSAAGSTLPLPAQLEALEQQRIFDALERCGGNQSEAARRLGMPRGRLITRLTRYGAPRPRKSPTAR